MRSVCAGVVLLGLVALPAEASPALPSAQVRLPSFADEPVTLSDPKSGVGVAVRAIGAARVGAEPLSLGLSFPNAFGDAHVLITQHEGGFEDTTYFQSKPAREEARYEVQLENAAGLRLFDDVLEVLDQDGTPRLRMSRPWIRDRYGEVHMLEVQLVGCAFDESARPPWRRPTVDPESDRCELVLDWSQLRLSYPAELDPSWTVTGGILEKRFSASLCANQQGIAALAGGNTLSGFPSNSAELFDLATETWTAIAPMYRALQAPTCVALADGRFMFSGGLNGSPVPSYEIFDPATGAWTSGSMLESRSEHTLTLLPDGRVMAAGGFSGVFPIYSSAELYDPATNEWKLMAPLSTVRIGHSAVLLPDGRVLVAGGNTNGVGTAELLDTTTLTWSPAANMGEDRKSFPLVLAGERILAVGGAAATANGAWVQSYDPIQDAWTSLAPIPLLLRDHHALPLPSGRVLLFGGSHDLGIFVGAYAYDWDLDSWVFAGPGTDRTEGLAAVLSDGSLLAATGHSGESALFPLSALRFVESTLGSACTEDGACESSRCRDGVCCETSCDGTCERCGEGGECLVVASTDDPDTCTGNASCSATGQCKQAEGISCTAAASCASGHCVDGVCCDRACDATCEACDGATLGVCEFVVGLPHGERPACPEGAVCGGEAQDCVGLDLCENDHFAVGPDGSLRDCSPFVCTGNGTCLQTCGSFLDCAAPFVCDASGDCVEPSFEQPALGCSAGRSYGEAHWWLASLLLALVRPRRYASKRG